MVKMMDARSFWLGFIPFAIILGLGLVSLVWTPYDPYAFNEYMRLTAPTLDHWLGTDFFGRDLLSRMMIATQLALFIALGAVILAGFFGVMLGIIIALSPKWISYVVTVLLDFIMIFPTIILVLIIISLYGSSVTTMIFSLSMANIPRFSKITVAVLAEHIGSDYLMAASSLGSTTRDIIKRHLLPLLSIPISHTVTISMAAIILSEAGLSFLGLGIMPPNPSWGYTLNEARLYIFSHPHLAFAPGLFIFITILSLNLMSYALGQK